MAIQAATLGTVGSEGKNRRLHAMFDRAPGFVARLVGPDHVFDYANPAFLLLAAGRDLQGKPLREAMPETVPQGVVAILDDAWLTGRAHVARAWPVWLAQPDGMRRLHHLDLVFQPLRCGDDDGDGAVTAIFVQGSDVSDAVDARNAQHDSDAKFAAFSQAMPHQVWTAAADGKVDWFNEHAYAYTGLDFDALSGTGWTRVVHPDDLTAVTMRWATALAGGAPLDVEFRMRAADGRYRWHLARALPLCGGGGEVTRWIGTSTDINEQKATARRLQHLNAGLEHQIALRTAERDRMWRLSRDVMLVAGVDGTVEAVSPAFTALLGWDEDDIVGKGFLDRVHPDDRAVTHARLAALGDGQCAHKFENRYRRKDGGWCLLSWSATPDAHQIYAIGRDITADRDQAEQMRRTELALQQAQKMETIGKLTGGVAHDFNNLLQIVSGNLQLIEMGGGAGDGPDTTARWIGNARSAVEKGAKLASYLLAFGRRQPLEPKVVKVSRVVSQMEDMLRRALGELIEIEFVTSGGLWHTAVDVAQLENAVLNLAINGRDAMAGGASAGRLTIEADNAVLDDAYCRTHADVAPGQYVMLAVTDNGAGMAPEVLEQAFEPFFSTKDEGKGSGLGLSMVYGFVKQSGGHVKIDSEPGRGTTVRLYLPRSTAVPDEPRASVEAQVAVGGTETILVAEDDAAVRATVVDMLSALGYRVLTATDAAGALAVVESGMRIDVLFTDVVMPGSLRSIDLARMARARLPDLAVLFTSGYTENAIVHGGRLDPGVELLGKPYTRESLARRIRQVLAGQRQRAQAEAPADVAPNAAPNVASDTAPRADAHRAGQLADQATPQPASGLRIVLVEDEDEIRDSTATLLRHLGHTVLEAADAEQALGLIDASTHVLVTDVQLPGMSGDLLATQARTLAPGIRIVFATGKGEVDNWPDAVVLRKPYNFVALVEALATG
jgi:PAS domain S-box-containing protein